MIADSPKHALPLNQCLAKTWIDAAGTVKPGRDVLTHCEIAGAVAREYLERLGQIWTALREIYPENSYLAPLTHDIGKIYPTFQHKIWSHCGKIPQGLEEWQALDEASWGGHSAVSHAAIRNCGADRYFAICIGQHHSRAIMEKPSDCQHFGGAEWENARKDAVAQLVKDTPFPTLKENVGLVAGLTILSDWIASGPIFDDPEKDWRKLVPKALDEAGFIWPRYKTDLSFREIFGFEPTETQAAFAKTVSGPGVYILEAPMGSGKTEAALYAAYRLLSSHKASGLYFGLPTQLTSNTMRERIEGFLGQILLDEGHAVLAHGNAWLTRYMRQEMGQHAAPGGSWFEQNRRAVLAPFAVGTVDQALMAILRVRFSPLRLAGLAGKVVILDEIHSFDAYTGYLLEQLISQLARLGATVIVLSATLTQERRDAILKACGSSAATPANAPYPLISLSSSEEKAPEISIPENVTVSIAMTDSETNAMDEILDRAEKGEQCLWLENTVKTAQETYHTLAAIASSMGIECGLIHSRFTPHDRQINEARWTNILGKSGASGQDARYAKGRILVGTQVLEQSLDIDADFMVTRFAPTDLLFQRMGRLWRHKRENRPNGAMRKALLLAPNLEAALADPKKAFSDKDKSAYVYDPYILARSLEVWTGRDSVNLPGDIRAMLEASHEKRKMEESPAMEKQRKELDKKIRELKGKARQNITSLGKYISDEAATTRLSDREMVKVLLLKFFDPDAAACVLLDGTRLDLKYDQASRVQIASELARHALSVPASSAPGLGEAKSHKLFEPYIYEAKSHNHGQDPASLRVLLIGESSYAADIYGKPLNDVKYTKTCGYEFAKDIV